MNPFTRMHLYQYGTSTKRFLDIITVSLGSQTEGPTFEHIIRQQGNSSGGMYPSFIEDADGEEIENPISIVKEQSGETVHFLDMEMVQSKPGVSQIRMYDKRNHMATSAEYCRYPHVETRLSQSCIYAKLHCQLCRFATRCTEILYFQIAAAKLIRI